MLLTLSVTSPEPPTQELGNVPNLTTSGTVVTVTNSVELADAYFLLSNQAGGGIISCEPALYGQFRRYPFGSSDGGQPVIIRSSDVLNRAQFTNFYLREVNNIRVENVTIDSTSVDGFGNFTQDVFVQDCSWIQFVGCRLLNDVNNEQMDLNTSVGSMAAFYDCTDVIFSNNYANGFKQGFEFRNVQRIDFIRNEFENFQGDAMRGGGMQNGLIKQNYFHDFVHLAYEINHPDLIQFWGVSVSLLTQDVTITENILVQAVAASQTIFIKNESFGQSGVLGGGYENLTITDNLIYNNHIWGIHLDGVDTATISNNTLLKNDDAYIWQNGGQAKSTPEIFQRKSDTGGVGIIITDNVAKNITAEAGVVVTGNELVDFTTPADPDYVTNHFSNPLANSAFVLSDLDMLPGSAWFGNAGCSNKVWPIP